MTFNHFNRRTHLYLGMFLLPWFFVYGISSVFFSHQDLLQRFYEDGVPDWTLRFERDYHLATPANAEIRQIGAQIIRDAGLNGSFGADQPNPERINVYCYDFFSAQRVTYLVKQNRLRVEDRRFRWDHFLTGTHARGGFNQESVLSDTWAVLVDFVCVAMLVWIASGIYMWWGLRQTRTWGALALGSGTLLFAIFLWAL